MYLFGHGSRLYESCKSFVLRLLLAHPSPSRFHDLVSCSTRTSIRRLVSWIETTNISGVSYTGVLVQQLAMQVVDKEVKALLWEEYIARYVYSRAYPLVNLSLPGGWLPCLQEMPLLRTDVVAGLPGDLFAYLLPGVLSRKVMIAVEDHFTLSDSRSTPLLPILWSESKAGGSLGTGKFGCACTW